MDLTREFVDVAVFTNHLDQMRDFYGGKPGLALPWRWCQLERKSSSIVML